MSRWRSKHDCSPSGLNPHKLNHSDKHGSGKQGRLTKSRTAERSGTGGGRDCFVHPDTSLWNGDRKKLASVKGLDLRRHQHVLHGSNDNVESLERCRSVVSRRSHGQVSSDDKINAPFAAVLSQGQNFNDSDLLLVSSTRGKQLKRKHNGLSTSTDSPSVRHSPTAESSSKRTRYSGKVQNVSVNTESAQRSLGKKSFLRRAEADMLAASSGKGMDSKMLGSRGKPEVHGPSRPVTRHSLSNTPSTNAQKFNHLQSGRSEETALKQGQRRSHCGSHGVSEDQNFMQTSVVASKLGTSRAKGSREVGHKVIHKNIDLRSRNGLSSTKKDLGSAASRTGVHKNSTSSVEQISLPRNSSKMTNSYMPTGNKMGNRLRKRSDSVDGSAPIRTRSGAHNAVQNSNSKVDTSLYTRPKRNSLKIKCECCHNDDGESPGESPQISCSDSDSEWQAKRKKQTRVRKSRKRSGGHKLKNGHGKIVESWHIDQPYGMLQQDEQFLNQHGQASGLTKPSQVYLMAAESADQVDEMDRNDSVYPVCLHDVRNTTFHPLSAYKNGLPPEVVSDEMDKNGKDEQGYDVYIDDRKAKMPGEVVFMGKDYYVEFACSDTVDSTEDTLDDDFSHNLDGVLMKQEVRGHTLR